MGQYSSYYLYQKYERRCSACTDADWVPCYPNTYSISGDSTTPLAVVMKEENDPQCGYIPVIEPQYRWSIVDGYICAECDQTKVIIHTSADTIYVNGSGEITRSEVSDYASGATDVVITNNATSIGNDTFSGFDGIEFVRIPNSVTSIGDKAFYGCSAMTDCQIPYGVLSVGNSAFTNSTSLMFADIPETVTSLGDACFKNCANFRYASIPSSIRDIPSECFYNCDGLSDIEIPSSVSGIGDSAFAECSGLYSVTVNNTVPPTLGSDVFYLANQDLNIYVPCESLYTYRAARGWSSYASKIWGISTCPLPANTKFYATYNNGTTYSADCDSNTTLTSATTKPSGYQYSAMTSAEIGDCVTTIGDNAFYGCINLTTCTIPSGITSIGQYTFYYCTSLTNVNIPSGITKIGEWAFSNCSSLKSINIPSGVTYIGDYALGGCSGLTSITFNSTIPPSVTTNFLGSGVWCPIYVPCNSVDTYKAVWSNRASQIYGIPPCEAPTPTSNTKFYATYNNGTTYSADCDSNTTLTTATTKPSGYQKSTMTSAEIGDCVTTIGDNAFMGCYILSSVTIPHSVVAITGDDAFFYCNELTDIYIPNSVAVIGSYSISSCQKLKSIRFEENSNLMVIGNYAFRLNYALSSITIPNSVVTIGEEAFYKCSGMTTCTIGSGVTSIGDNAFYSCSSLISITCLATTPPKLLIHGTKQYSSAFMDTNNCPIYVPSGSLNVYRTAQFWSEYASRIQAIT